MFLGKDRKKKELLAKLPAIIVAIGDEHGVSPNDFPPEDVLREKLEKADWSSFRQE